MSSRSSSGSGVGSTLNQVSYHDTCTFIKQKDFRSSYGCYLYRSCQSCLQSDGCTVNDMGICVSTNQGLYNLETGAYQFSTNYYPPMNYLNAISQGLALPAAASSNAAALSAEQNWHFRAGEATYCSASDATCQACKRANFYRGNDSSVLPDSRFCVGENNCVCIQTCEVPSYKAPGCQWKLSSTQYGDDNAYYYFPKERLVWWHWVLIVVVIVVVHLVFKYCGRSKARARHIKEAREVAVSTVRRELGVITNDAPLETNAAWRTTHQLVRSQTMLSDLDYEELYKHNDNVGDGSRSNFVEVMDVPLQPARTVNSTP